MLGYSMPKAMEKKIWNSTTQHESKTQRIVVMMVGRWGQTGLFRVKLCLNSWWVMSGPNSSV